MNVSPLVVSAALAVTSAVVMPRLLGPQSRPAGSPFVYQPPGGFTPVKTDVEGTQAWVLDDPVGEKRSVFKEREAALVRAVVHHSDKRLSVTEGDLAKLAEGMPEVFAKECDWSHRRHERRTRPDGASVGLIEGDCQREVGVGVLGAPPQTLRARKLQLVFPDDSGTSIATISYPTEQAARYEPLFESTIGTARGVATRVPPPSSSTYIAWGAAGAVLGWLAAVVARKRTAR